MISALAVHLDQDEYSRYDPTAAVVTARILATDATQGDVISWALVRQGGYGVVTSGTVIAPATGASVPVPLALDLRQVYDADFINWVVQGDYTLTATAGAVSASSPAFPVDIVRIAEFQERWLAGVSLEYFDVLTPVVPPQQVTGVTFERLSSAHELGGLPLAYVTAADSGDVATLSWAGGPAVPIPALGGRLVLQDANALGPGGNTGAEYAILRVDPTLLPTASVTETLIIDRQRMDTQIIRNAVRLAAGSLASALHVPIEPRRVCTPLLARNGQNTYRDDVLQAETWYRPFSLDEWVVIQLPLLHLLRVYNLSAFVNSSQTTRITDDWITFDERLAQIQLVPKYGAILSWQFWQAAFLQVTSSRATVPDFWHYDVAHGLRTLDTALASPVREALSKMASIEILLQAGSAWKAGIASESTSRDGISQSTSYTQSAMYGLFAHLTEPYKDWLKENIPRLRTRINGPEFRTL